jgi:protocatechuate 3,4-dioxygenase beta subunit
MRRRIGLGVLAVLVLLGLALWWRQSRPPGAERSTAAGSLPSLRARPDFAPAPVATSALVAPRATITGRVSEPGGAPIAGALVCGQGVAPDLSENELRDPSCTLSGADGRYRLGNLYAATWLVTASAAGHRPGRFREVKRETLDLAPGQERGGVDLILRRGGVEARGRVKDIGGGIVAGALVSVKSAGAWWEDTGAVTRADEKGEWRAWVAPGRVQAIAQAAGYAPGEREGMAPGSFIEILLTPESVLVGRVVEAGSRQPVSGALVVPGEVSSEGSFAGGSSALSDADGRFRLERLRPGRYKPLARSATRYGQARESVVLGLGERSSEVLIEVHPAVTLTGKVLITGTEEPCRAGWIILGEPKTGERLNELIRHDGSVELRGLQPGRYQVTIMCTDFLSEDRYPPLVVTDRPLPPQTWHVRPGLHIAGTVVDADGAPARGGSIAVSLSGGDPRGQRVDSWEEIRPDGTFEVGGLLPGTYQLRTTATALPEPKEPTKVALAGRSVDGLRIVLERAGTVKGSVVDQDGHPVAGVGVQAGGETWSWSGNMLSRDDGSFLIEGLRPGDYRITAQRRDWGEGLRAPGSGDDDLQGVRVTVKAGAVVPVKLVVEGLTGRITGTVKRNGKPVTDAFVDCQRESESATAAEGEAQRRMRFGWNRQPAATDGDGRFSLSELAPGKYLVRAYRKGGGEASVEHVAVGSAVTLVIKPTGVLGGTVAVAGRAPPEQFRISVVDEAAGLEVTETFWRTAGAWVMRELPGGRFDIHAVAPEGEARDKVTLGEGQAREGIRLEMKPRATVRGQLVALDSGKPVAGMRVIAQFPSSANRISYDHDAAGERKNISDAEGRFQLDDAPVGRVLIVAFPTDMEQVDYDFCLGRATLQAGQELTLPPIRCAHRRVKGRDVGGDLGFALKEVAPTAVAEPIPLVVAVVRPGGPAAAAGLKVNDVVTSIDGQDLTGPNDYFFWTLSRVPQGTTVALGVARGGTLSVTAGPQP